MNLSPRSGESKAQLRLEMRARLAALDDRAGRSRKICAALTSRPAWRSASFVALFAPMKSEPDLEMLWPEAEGRTLCFPRIDDGRLAFVAVSNAAALLAGERGFHEPDAAGVAVPAERFDLILVPGLAFSRAGSRIGRGGGFYDRFLSIAGLRAATIGVCFDMQLVDSLPTEAHDRSVDCVITESGVQL